MARLVVESEETLNYRAWLKTLKVGDTYKAFFPSLWGTDRVDDIVITRVSDKSVYAYGFRFNKSDGKCYGSRGFLAKPATTEQIESANLGKMRDKVLRSVDDKLKRMNLAQVTRVLDIFNEIKEG